MPISGPTRLITGGFLTRPWFQTRSVGQRRPNCAIRARYRLLFLLRQRVGTALSRPVGVFLQMSMLRTVGQTTATVTRSILDSLSARVVQLLGVQIQFFKSSLRFVRYMIPLTVIKVCVSSRQWGASATGTVLPPRLMPVVCLM